MAVPFRSYPTQVHSYRVATDNFIKRWPAIP